MNKFIQYLIDLTLKAVSHKTLTRQEASEIIKRLGNEKK